MPEYPDVQVYCDRIEALIVGRPLLGLRIGSPFLLRTVEPPVSSLAGQTVTGVRRIGKRIVLAFPDEVFAVVHLMIAGRLRWKAAGASIPGRVGLACFDFDHGTLVFTEASKKKRAKLHLVVGEAALAEHDPGGLNVLTASADAFAERLRLRNHTVKRALTDPRLFDGIGNAYSDEILWAAKLSPVRWTSRLTDDEVVRLYETIKAVLVDYHQRMTAEVGEGFPDKVTAFRDDMAVHGKFRQPCPVCEQPIQRIRYANYCARCQNADKLLADRGLSRLLKKDWPKTLGDLEERLKG